MDFVVADGARVSAHAAIVAARCKWLRNKVGAGMFGTLG